MDSIYPEFFKSGLDKLQANEVGVSDLQTLFAALENYHRDIRSQESAPAILRSTQLYVSGLNLFHTTGFYLINPDNLDFELTLCAPAEDRGALETLVQQEIFSGKFAWALRKNGPVFFETEAAGVSVRGVFHSLAVASRQVGMFCGLLKKERLTRHEIGFNLLSILLNTTVEALASSRNLAEMKNQILAANRDLQRTLRENEVLARIPAESPSPILRLGRSGQILYRNEAAKPVLRSLGCQVGDLVTGQWADILEEAFEQQVKQEFEVQVGRQCFAFVAVALPEAGYANFYGIDITQRKCAESEREQLIDKLQEALTKVKTLSGLLPICAWCKKIRDDQGYWKQIESFIQSRSEAVFSHSVCPECSKKLIDPSS